MIAKHSFLSGAPDLVCFGLKNNLKLPSGRTAKSLTRSVLLMFSAANNELRSKPSLLTKGCNSPQVLTAVVIFFIWPPLVA